MFEDSDDRIEEMNVRLKAAAREAGLPFGYRTMTYNSRPAQELSKWAESEGKGDAFRQAVFEAYFVGGKNIGRPELLVGLAAAAGLSGKKAREVIDTGTFKAAVDRDWSRALRVDPEYIPALMVNGSLLINPQKYSLFEQFMRDNRIEKK